MNRVYPSKIGIEILIITGLPLALVLFISAFQGFNWVGIGVVVFLCLLMLYLFRFTKYTIEGNDLKISSGFLYNKKISIRSIRKIKATNNPLSAPAVSLDRLEIVFDKNERVLISPKEKDAFVAHIQTLNPAVEVDLKK